MNTEIEKIIQADEAAREAVEAAEAGARKIRDEALRKGQEILLQGRVELEKAVGRETEQILQAARAKALSIREETDRYLERMQKRKREILDQQMRNLLKKVAGF